LARTYVVSVAGTHAASVVGNLERKLLLEPEYMRREEEREGGKRKGKSKNGKGKREWKAGRGKGRRETGSEDRNREVKTVTWKGKFEPHRA
jgi:hypothetical protein